MKKPISGGFPKVKGKIKCDMEAAALLAETEMQDLYKYILFVWWQNTLSF